MWHSVDKLSTQDFTLGCFTICCDSNVSDMALIRFCTASGHHCQVLDRLMGYARAFSSEIVRDD